MRRQRRLHVSLERGGIRARAAAQHDERARLLEAVVLVADQLPDELGRVVKAEMATWRQVVAKAGLKP